MAISQLPLCDIPKVVSKDGYTGLNAHIMLPFYNNLYFFSGQDYTWPSSTIPQDQSTTFSGTSKPNTFRKDCCTCVQD